MQAAAAAGPWIADYSKGNKKPAFFRNPVHCVKIANDGKIYVCDRGNDRIQVFDKNDPALGKPCSNPTGEPGKCGFVAEQFISEHTNTSIPGTAVSMSFSSDKAQSCLYVGDNSNMTIYILNRSNLQELGRLGRSGRMAGEFHWLHQVSVDSKGNIYTAEVDTGKTDPEVPPLRRERVQRNRIVYRRRSGGREVVRHYRGSGPDEKNAICRPLPVFQNDAELRLGPISFSVPSSGDTLCSPGRTWRRRPGRRGR